VSRDDGKVVRVEDIIRRLTGLKMMMDAPDKAQIVAGRLGGERPGPSEE
jgi:hypothetical protein